MTQYYSAYLIEPLVNFTLGNIYIFSPTFYYPQYAVGHVTHDDKGLQTIFKEDFETYFKKVEDFREERLNKIIN